MEWGVAFLLLCRGSDKNQMTCRSFVGENWRIECIMHSFKFEKKRREEKSDGNSRVAFSQNDTTFYEHMNGENLVNDLKVPSIWSMLQMITTFTLQTEIMLQQTISNVFISMCACVCCMLSSLLMKIQFHLGCASVHFNYDWFVYMVMQILNIFGTKFGLECAFMNESILRNFQVHLV